MKSVNILLFLILASTAFAKAQFTKAELQVSGLNCSLCSKTTVRALSELTFVSEIKTDLMHNMYILTFKSETPVNFDEISKIVHDESFFVSSLKATFNFKDVKVTDKSFISHGDTYQVINKTDKPLEGEVTVMLIDKGFAPKSVSKKYLVQVADVAAPANGKVYHVAI
jgi:copper chaperone CopZ